MLEVGGYSQHYWTWKKKKKKKNQIFQFLTKGAPCLQNESHKIYKEWPNLNTVKISFCKVTVPLIKFAIKDVKIIEKRQKMATLPIFSTL